MFRKMTILKSIVATFLFIVVLNIVSLWALLDFVDQIYVLTKGYFFLITGILEFIVVLIILYLYYGRKEIIVKNTPLIYYLFAFLFSICIKLVLIPLNYLYNIIFNSEYKIIYDLSFSNKFNLIVFSGIAFLSISEELFFRRFIQNELYQKYNIYVAIGVSASLFASFHLGIDEFIFGQADLDFYHAYTTFFSGLLLGILYYKSNSIGPPIVLHIIFNLIGQLT